MATQEAILAADWWLQGYDDDNVQDDLNSLAELLDEYRSTLWHPIYTAPKDGTWIIVAVPPKVVPKGGNSKWKFAWRHLVVKWAQAPEPLPQRQIGIHAQELDQKHGGYWSCNPSGIRPIHGLPLWWMPIPRHPTTKDSAP